MLGIATTSVHYVDERLTPDGSQVIRRAAALLRVVSSQMPIGSGTSEIARAAGLSRPTAHRLLVALSAEGFLDRDSTSGNWVLGPELYLQGAVASARFDVSEFARPHVAALAEETGESAFFSVRRGNETVCLLREDGSFPIRSFVLFEGKRFPLGVASAGLAIIAFLDSAVVHRYLAEVDLTAEYGETHSAGAIRDRIEATRTVGYSLNPGLIVPGSWGMGAAVFDPSGQPAWALSLTGVESRFSQERQGVLGQRLLHHAHKLSQVLATRP